MKRVFAYIDESGAKTGTDPRQRFFVMSAVLMLEEDKPRALELLVKIRSGLKKKPDTRLHWRNIKGEDSRKIIVREISAAPFLTTISVVIAHDYLLGHRRIREEHFAYVYTLQFLVERLSWYGRQIGRQVCFCMERPVRLTNWKFRTLMAAVHSKKSWDAFDAAATSEHHAKRSGTKWPWIGGYRLDSPIKVPLLQLADLFASSTAMAFVQDDRRWLDQTKVRIWRRGQMATYGMKIHPWGRNVKAQHDLAWVNVL